MLPAAQKIIDDGLRSIVEKVLNKTPWDPSFGFVMKHSLRREVHFI